MYEASCADNLWWCLVYTEYIEVRSVQIVPEESFTCANLQPDKKQTRGAAATQVWALETMCSVMTKGTHSSALYTYTQTNFILAKRRVNDLLWEPEMFH